MIPAAPPLFADPMVDSLRAETARLAVALAEAEVALLTGRRLDLAPLGQRLERLCRSIQGLAAEATAAALRPGLSDLMAHLERLERRLAADQGPRPAG
ncbi:hypothetical protein [Roseospirillum parvum]|uniref:Uncharacterized protein n=1 Tax=Roseospirillum parvum TaxID=83401 RepID=A0A1G8DIQ1_9PROT|nr:hypothetical protein [Roseospirillum parvum]SDH57250.1 hypothetical protein SAMN05421742_10823 [Roseospirillum parvum]